jgi:lysophospholipase L1-like esterase
LQPENYFITQQDMKKTIIASMLLTFSLLRMSAAVDENFYIYLCFGQSNTEGNANPEAVDKLTVDPRFQMLATTNFTSPARTMGEWYTATTPIAHSDARLSWVDYFGRCMVAALPATHKVGVVTVAMGGAGIDLFDKENYAEEMKKTSDWPVILANRHYNGKPYQRLLDMARKAQEAGVIKGILMHQGETNNGNQAWLEKVKKIYNDLLGDLGLQAADVPLLAGETVDAEEGGACSLHNTVIAQLPSVIPTAHVIRSNSCTCQEDKLHFTASGYRIMGRRYATEILHLMGRQAVADANYTLPLYLSSCFSIKELVQPADVLIKLGGSKQLTLSGTFTDGHREDLTAETTFTSSDFTITDGVLKGTEEKSGTVTATYTDFTGATHTATINVTVTSQANSVLVFDDGNGGSNLWDYQGIYTLDTPMTKGKNYVVKATIMADNGGQLALWPIWSTSPNRNEWNMSADVQYLAAKNVTNSFAEYRWDFTANFDHDKLQFVFGQIAGKVYFDDVSCVEKATGVEMIENGNFESDDLSHWSVNWNGPKYSIEDDPTTGIAEIVCDNPYTSTAVYDLYGRKMPEGRLPRGLYITGGRKFLVK